MRFSSFLGWAVELNGTIFVQVFIFLSLLVWLSPTLFGPIMRLFEEREQRIDGAKRIAAELSGFADEKAKLFQIEYEKARTEARHTLTALKLEMEREYSESP
jgi:F-type H+-transporting ATPase subunit b